MYNRISDTSFFPKTLNFFTKLVYKQIGEALQSVKCMKRLREEFHSSA